MPGSLTPLPRRVSCLVAVVLFILGLSPFAANADISSGLRDLLQGALGTDLRIDSFVLNRSQATIGDTLRATVRVSNQGKAAATATVLTHWAAFGSSTSTANAYRLATVRLGTLQSMTSVTSVTTFPVPNLGRLGAYQIFATVDSSSTEANKQNNTQAKTLQVIGPALSDTDPTPVSDPDASAPPPPASTPVAGGGSSSPPASGPPAASAPPPPVTESPAGPGSPAPPPSSSPGSGSSSAPPPPPPPVSTAPRTTCDFYASPNGRGSGTTPESPFTIQDFWGVAGPGRTLCLLNGTYQGASNMIDPGIDARGLSGTNGKPITIRALNDGQVLINGQFANRPVYFSGNSYYIIEGINAKNSPAATGSAGAILGFWGGSNNNIVRRAIFWDAGAGKNSTAVVLGGGSSSTNNLLEDVAIFGMTGRKMLGCGGASGGRNTVRRVWIRHEGAIAGGSGYDVTMYYNSSGCRLENVLLTFDRSLSHPQSFTEQGGEGYQITNFGSTDDNKGMLTADRKDTGEPQCANAEVNGALIYLRRGAIFIRSRDGVPATGASIVNLRNADCVTVRHVYAYIEPAASFFNTYRTFALGLRRDGSTPANVSASNITSVRGSQDERFSAGWSVSGHSQGSTIASVPSAWTATTTGANLCKQWKDGVLTNEPLWPWPMNDRIKAATLAAGSYTANGGPCPTCVYPGGNSRVRTETDVTADVEAMLGPIPAQCRK